MVECSFTNYFGIESRCCHLNFTYCTCFEQGVPWHSGNKCRFTLKRVNYKIITYKPIHSYDTSVRNYNIKQSYIFYEDLMVNTISTYSSDRTLVLSEIFKIKTHHFLLKTHVSHHCPWDFLISNANKMKIFLLTHMLMLIFMEIMVHNSKVYIKLTIINQILIIKMLKWTEMRPSEFASEAFLAHAC